MDLNAVKEPPASVKTVYDNLQQKAVRSYRDQVKRRDEALPLEEQLIGLLLLRLKSKQVRQNIKSLLDALMDLGAAVPDATISGAMGGPLEGDWEVIHTRRDTATYGRAFAFGLVAWVRGFWSLDEGSGASFRRFRDTTTDERWSVVASDELRLLPLLSWPRARIWRVGSRLGRNVCGQHVRSILIGVETGWCTQLFCFRLPRDQDRMGISLLESVSLCILPPFQNTIYLSYLLQYA